MCELCKNHSVDCLEPSQEEATDAIWHNVNKAIQEGIAKAKEKRSDEALKIAKMIVQTSEILTEAQWAQRVDDVLNG